MSRWAKRPEEQDISIEQFQLWFEERVIQERKKRLDREARGLPPEMVRPRKLSPVEARHLEKLEERRRLEKEMEEAGF